MSTTNESSPPSLIGRHVTAAALRLPGVPHPASRVRGCSAESFRYPADPPLHRFAASPLRRRCETILRTTPFIRNATAGALSMPFGIPLNVLMNFDRCRTTSFGKTAGGSASAAVENTAEPARRYLVIPLFGVVSKRFHDAP
ncbi:hypothetical protein ISG25_27675, partial [Burkholderia pseudomallei]|nr:hypothetical protein [Burkholderia pseudomallei]MBF3845436.1 hypothetical protein [Burkholderia pseudomallei]